MLIVVSIVATLATLTIMVTRNVRQQANWVVCLSNQRQIYHALRAHAEDHRGKAFATARLWSDALLFPNAVQLSGPNAERDDLSWPQLETYFDIPLDGSGYSDTFLNENGSLVKQPRLPSVWKHPGDAGLGYLVDQGDGNAYFHPFYSYFGRVSSWAPAESAACRDLAMDSFNNSADRVVLADLFQYSNGLHLRSGFLINHARDRVTKTLTDVLYTDVRGIYPGMNRIFNDGRGERKPPSAFDLDAVVLADPAQPFAANALFERWYF